ncbi:MAG: hypothetical protein IPL46_06365 [Saprospiraceae bacterium]|nr:hypothetical protein [Saprospiraceae bacterium]
MSHLLLFVTDLELTVSQIVKSILLVVVFVGLIINLYKVFKSPSIKIAGVRITFSFLLLISMYPVFQWIKIDGAMLVAPLYVEGRTTGMCQVFARGKGIGFEYEVSGKKYVGCDTYHPMKLEDLMVPDGYYYVRYSQNYPDQGRIDFNKRIR